LQHLSTWSWFVGFFFLLFEANIRIAAEVNNVVVKAEQQISIERK